jgi:chaperonin GroES
MAKFKVRPLEDRVIVEPMEAESVTAGGIVLPDSSKEKPQRGAVGDEVVYGKYSGTEIEIGGDSFKILRESDILAKVLA